MTLDILGSQWTLEYRKLKDDDRLENCDGYADWTTRLIVVEDEIEGNLGDMTRYKMKVARHEIIHAFLLECGLAESSAPCEAWASNEEMVDWLARMGPRIYKAWEQAKVFVPEDLEG
jgi:hypothetical protein